MSPSVWIEKRQRPRGNAYYVRWRIGSEKRTQHCGYNKAYAEEFRSKKERELWEGVLGIRGRQGQKPWPEFAKEYLEYSRTHKASNTFLKFDRPAIQSFSEVINTLFLGAIHSQHIEKWKMKLLERLSPNTVRMQLRALKAAFSYAVRLGQLSKNPATAVKAPSEQKVGRVLSDIEIERLLCFLRPDKQRIVCFCLYTGLRLGELLDLDWKQIKQPQDGLWALHFEPGQTKTRQGRIIPIHPAARDILGPPKISGGVFEVTLSGLEQAFRKAVRKTGLGRIRFHDLRHTWATRFMEKTGDIFALMRLGGWRSIQSVTQYQHLTQARQDAILSLDFGFSAHVLPTLEGSMDKKES